MEDIYMIARQRAAEATGTMLEEAFHGRPKKEKSERRKALDYARYKRYRQSPKGKKANARKCKKWQDKHRRLMTERAKKFKDKFFARCGIKYGTFLYRRKKGLPLPDEAMKYIKEREVQNG